MDASPFVAVFDNHDLGTRCRRRGVHPIGVQKLTTPQVEEVAACPGSAQEGPARRGARIKALAERRAGGACVPTWASGGISCGS